MPDTINSILYKFLYLIFEIIHEKKKLSLFTVNDIILAQFITVNSITYDCYITMKKCNFLYS